MAEVTDVTAFRTAMLCRGRYGLSAHLEVKHFVLPTSGATVTLYYCWLGGVLKAVGRDWPHMLDREKI